MKQTVHLMPEDMDLIGFDLMKLYKLIALSLGHDTLDPLLRYDCRHIDVAQNIQHIMERAFLDAPGYEGDRELAFAMHWCCSGPKAIASLEDYTVEVDDSFIFYVNKFPDPIMRKLRERLGLEAGDTTRDAEINRYGKFDAFCEVCNWEGIVDYGFTIAGWINDIFDIDLREISD